MIDHLRSLAGTHLDPTVVSAFLALLDQDGGARPGGRLAVATAAD